MTVIISNTESLSISQDSLIWDQRGLRKNIRPTDITIYSCEKNEMTFKELEMEDVNKKNKLTFSGHYYVRRNGDIFRGRPEDVIGEFAYNMDKSVNLNYNNIGICVEGDFNKIFLNDVQFSSLLELCEDIRNRYTKNMRIRFLNQFDLGVNPGILFSFTEVMASYNKTLTPAKVLIGKIEFDTLGSRELYLDNVNPITGTDVYAIQTIMKDLNIYEIDPTGVFDSYTLNCVKIYQMQNNLADSGIAGFKTLHHLINDMKKINSTKIFTRVLEFEAGESVQSGDDVYNLQVALNNKYFNCRVTGEYDKDTIEQIRNFQSKNNIDPDGKVGPITWNLLMSGDSSDNFRVLRLNKDNIMYGTDVKELQEKLVSLGYIMPVTEKYDYLTEAQVRRYQIHNGLTATGVVDRDLWDRIFN